LNRTVKKKEINMIKKKKYEKRKRFSKSIVSVLKSVWIVVKPIVIFIIEEYIRNNWF
jgi:hypothetical protein